MLVFIMTAFAEIIIKISSLINVEKEFSQNPEVIIIG